MKITIIRPSQGHSAYRIAAQAFADLAYKTSEAEATVITDREAVPDDASPIVVIGTDAVNLYTADLYMNRKIDDFGYKGTSKKSAHRESAESFPSFVTKNLRRGSTLRANFCLD